MEEDGHSGAENGERPLLDRGKGWSRGKGGEVDDKAFVDADVTWQELFEEGGVTCIVCNALVDDRRFAVGIAIRRAWSPGSTTYTFAHVECLRKAMPSSV